MTAEGPQAGNVLGRRTSRRAVLGGTIAAASVAVTYAALGDGFGLLGGEESAVGDTAAIEKEHVKVSHFLRRAGLGLTREEYDHYQTLGLQGSLDELLAYESIDDSEAVRRADELRTAGGDRPNAAGWWLTRMAGTKRPLQEKMTLFWHGLLTSQLSVVRDPNAMMEQNELLRTHALDTFPNMLKAITSNRAMMVYLNMDGSQRRAPNENYARELMELFALGEGNYTEDDVRQAARAFTGWQVPRSRPGVFPLELSEPIFRPQQFDNGSKTFMGQTGNFGPNDIVDIISRQDAAGEYVTRRLFTFFVYPNPDDKTLRPFVEVYNENGGSIRAVVDAMLRSDVMYSPRAYRAIIKSPVEYTLGAMKALGQQANTGVLAAPGPPGRAGGVLGAMGQIPFEPPNVAGWPGGAAWINSATLFARLNFLNTLVGGGLGRQGQQRQQQGQMAAPAGGQAQQGAQMQPGMRRQQAAAAQSSAGDPGMALGTASQALANYLPLLLDDNIPQEARAVLHEYAGNLEATLSPEQLRGLVYLILGSPQFHLS